MNTCAFGTGFSKDRLLPCSRPHDDKKRVLRKANLKHIAPKGAKRKFLKLIEFLLENQIVQFGQDTFEVILGTGMGLRHSGDLSDLVFMFLAEISWAADVRVQQRYHIRFFAMTF